MAEKMAEKTHAQYGGLKETVVLSQKEQVLKFLYDPETHYFCGRSCKNICFACFFHLFFYTALVGYLAILLYIDYLRRDLEIPQNSMFSNFTLLTEPGMSILPSGNQGKAAVMFKYKLGEKPKFDGSTKLIAPELQSFLDGYDGKPTHLYPCNKNAPGGACVMKTDSSSLGPCHSNNKDEFGYPKGKPCILIKLNKIFGWLPEVEGNSYNIPIKCSVRPALYADTFDNPPRNVIIKVYPEEGINGLCFPFCGKHKTYVQPFVMVQFENIPLNKDVAILCMAQNLKNVPEIDDPHRILEQIGSIGFILHIMG